MAVSTAFILDTAAKIGLPDALTRAALDRLSPRVLRRAERVKTFNRNALDGLKPPDKLAAVLSLLEWTKGEYDKKGIPDDVFYDTMTDIAVWCDDYRKKSGKEGLKNTRWIINHLNCDIFRLGRLQFQFSEFHLPLYASKAVKAKPPLPLGAPCLYVHIPAIGQLDEGECEKSFARAPEFFNRYFPEYNYVAYISESWLYYPQNAEFMDKNSNILKFSARFEVLASVAAPYAAYERLWGKRVRPDFKQDTSLQRSAYAYVKKGGRLGVGFGLIKRPPDCIN